MEAILERCAGLDVHQETIVACVLLGPLDRKPSEFVETFGTTTQELLRLQDWLLSHECIHVAMESTGVLWKPVWNILSEHCRLTLANPQRIKNLPGKKTDVKDSVWIAQLHRCGLIEGSFVPDVSIRDLRDLTRYRRKLVQNATQEKNRIHKILQDANIKLTTFVSDIFGVSGRALLDAIVDGEVLDAQEIRKLVKTRLINKIPELVDALNGRLRAHHRRMITRHLHHLYYLEEEIVSLELEIDQAVQPYRTEIELLDTIPGVNQASATALVAELGVDMSAFPTEPQIASWAGVCPANNESAGRRKRKKNTRGNKSLKATLCEAAWGAVRTKDSRISAAYNRLVKRCGKQKAIMAVAHLLLRIIYTMLRDKVAYRELGAAYLGSREFTADYWVRKLEQMGYKVDLTPAA